MCGVACQERGCYRAGPSLHPGTAPSSESKRVLRYASWASSLPRALAFASAAASLVPLVKAQAPAATDLADGTLLIDEAACVRDGKAGGRRSGSVERADHDHAERDKAEPNDEILDHRQPRLSIRPLVGGFWDEDQSGWRRTDGDGRGGLDSISSICTSSDVMNKGKQPNTRPAEAAVRMTTAEAAVGALIAHGIDTIYALPGVHNDCLFDALFNARDRIRTVHTRHEQGAAYLALGAALATGKPQVYSVVPGPGLLNS